jgi:hypothetical protein
VATDENELSQHVPFGMELEHHQHIQPSYRPLSPPELAIDKQPSGFAGFRNKAPGPISQHGFMRQRVIAKAKLGNTHFPRFILSSLPEENHDHEISAVLHL